MKKNWVIRFRNSPLIYITKGQRDNIVDGINISKSVVISGKNYSMNDLYYIMPAQEYDNRLVDEKQLLN